MRTRWPANTTTALPASARFLDRERDAETSIGTKFCGSDDPEIGSVGTVHEVRILSDRGKRIDRLASKLRVYLNMRDIVGRASRRNGWSSVTLAPPPLSRGRVIDRRQSAEPPGRKEAARH